MVAFQDGTILLKKDSIVDIPNIGLIRIFCDDSGDLYYQNEYDNKYKIVNISEVSDISGYLYSLIVNISGSTGTGQISGNYVNLSGDTMTGPLSIYSPDTQALSITGGLSGIPAVSIRVDESSAEGLHIINSLGNKVYELNTAGDQSPRFLINDHTGANKVNLGSTLASFGVPINTIYDIDIDTGNPSDLDALHLTSTAGGEMGIKFSDDVGGDTQGIKKATNGDLVFTDYRSPSLDYLRVSTDAVKINRNLVTSENIELTGENASITFNSSGGSGLILQGLFFSQGASIYEYVYSLFPVLNGFIIKGSGNYTYISDADDKIIASYSKDVNRYDYADYNVQYFVSTSLFSVEGTIKSSDLEFNTDELLITDVNGNILPSGIKYTVLSSKKQYSYTGVFVTTDYDNTPHGTNFGTIKYFLQLSDGTNIRSSEILASYSGSTVVYTESNILQPIGNITNATWSVIATGGDIVLRLTVTSGTYSVKISRESI